MKSDDNFWNITIDGNEIKIPKNSTSKIGVCKCCIEELKPLYEFLKNEFDDSGPLLNVTKIVIRVYKDVKLAFRISYEIENLFVIIFDSTSGFSIPKESQLKAHITIDANQLAHMLDLPQNPMDLYKRFENKVQIDIVVDNDAE